MNPNEEELEPSLRPTRRAGRWSAAIGALIGLAGATFVVQALYQDRDEIARALSNARPALLLGALVLVGLAMTGIGLAWRASVEALGGTLDVVSSLRGYFVGQLGKYLPGGIWAVMGRAEWARGEGVPGSIAYSSVFLSIGSAFLAALMLAAIVLPAAGLVGSGGDERYLWVLVLLPLGFALLSPKVLGFLLQILRKISRRDLEVQVPSWKASSLIVVRQLPSWLLVGTASWVIANAFGTRGDLMNIIFAVATSWVIGFIALPVPGGIGVREAAFVALATSLPTGVAAIVAVTARLVTIIVDTAGAASMTVLVSRRSRHPDRQ